MGLGRMSAYAADASGYKALVCIFIPGGVDMHDAIIPYDEPSYDAYAEIRRSLLDQYVEAGIGDTRARSGLTPLTPSNAGALGGRQFALAPQFGALTDRFNSGKLAIVGNVGPLEEPTTRALVKAKTARLPARLFSHNDQASMWETSGTEGTATGWGGRMLDRFADVSPFGAISIAGNPTYLTGDRARILELGRNGTPKIAGLGDWAYGSNRVPAALAEHYAAAGAGLDNLYARDIGAVQARAIALNEEISTLIDGVTTGDAVAVPGNSISEQLAMVAKIASLNAQIGVSRQVFYVRGYGVDTHNDQALRLPRLQAHLGEALDRFLTELEVLGLDRNVTAFTASDFGRTFTVNATGTDHGWGNHHLVLGGAVRGGRILGDIPPPEIDHEQDYGRGRLIPTTSLEQYGGALGRWFGLTDSELAEVFPNYGRFDPYQTVLF
jgi:uncharacterized protein (DUF1501 family)